MSATVPATPISRRFGPSALATPANLVTIARVVLAVPLFLVILDRGSGWLVWGGWVTLSVTDGLDGWIARRDGTTRSGAYLDPLADKFLTLGGFAVLVVNGVFWWLPVALMAARELGISVFRSIAGQRGISLPARWSGKAKTVCQLVAVGVPLLPLTAEAVALQTVLLWSAAALSMVSGFEIVRHGWVEHAREEHGRAERR